MDGQLHGAAKSLTSKLVDCGCGEGASPGLRRAGFDAVLCTHLRALASEHWTSERVCRRAAWLLRARTRDLILDVGSGLGKFCIVAALHHDGTYHGVEQRPALVHTARGLAAQLGATRTKFFAGDAFKRDWTAYQGLYFFNPFGELASRPDRAIDGTLSEDEGRYAQCIEATEQRLAQMPNRTRVVLYCGFGGRMPGSYGLISRELIAGRPLELWVKRPSKRVRRGAAPR